MLYQFFPAPGAACPAGSPFIIECDACQAKFNTPTPLLPDGWTTETIDLDDGTKEHMAFCRECTGYGEIQ